MKTFLILMRVATCLFALLFIVHFLLWVAVFGSAALAFSLIGFVALLPLLPPVNLIYAGVLLVPPGSLKSQFTFFLVFTLRLVACLYLILVSYSILAGTPRS